MSDESSGLEQFDGTARLFPLPNLVLFPYVLQGLHIFEPRYRQMTADALAADRLITPVLLQPGWESDYEGRPPVAAVGCIGRIIADQRLDDGRYNLQLRGLSRVRIVQEVDTGKLYRTAEVKLLTDCNVPPAAAEAKQRRKLATLLPAWCPEGSPVPALFRKLLETRLPLGTVCDVLTFALPVPLELRQAVLEELDVRARVDRVIEHLGSKAAPAATAPDHKFPPDFSTN